MVHERDIILLCHRVLRQNDVIFAVCKITINTFTCHQIVENSHCGIVLGDLSIQTGAILHHDINGTWVPFLCRLVEPSWYSPNMYQSPRNLSPINFYNTSNRRKFALWDRTGRSVDSDWSNIAPWYKRNISAILVSLSRDFMVQSEYVPMSPENYHQ